MPSLPETTNLKGKLLLAAPSMEDTFFEKTVILVTEHSKVKGASGFILNKPLGKTLSMERKDHPDFFPNGPTISIYVGGPVHPNELNILALSQQGSKLFYKKGIRSEEAASVFHTPNTIVHGFVGYSSWVPGQLENELYEGAWLILPALPQLVEMPHDQTLWRNILERTSPMHALLARAPKHSFLN